MLTPSKKKKIKRNIAMMIRMIELMEDNVNVTVALDMVADEFGESFSLVNKVYYHEEYHLSPFFLYDMKTGEVLEEIDAYEYYTPENIRLRELNQVNEVA